MSFDNSSRRTSTSTSFNFSVPSSLVGPKQKKVPNIIAPAIIEEAENESLQFRLNTLPDLKELGPPDLVHFSKYDSTSSKTIGEYHYVLGLDTSSIAQPFTYMQTIQLKDKSKQSSTHPPTATYCTYNCFTKGDLRMTAGISPVNRFIPQIQPQQKPKTYYEIDEKSSIWNEVYASSLIRSVLFSDDVERQLPGMCKFNPIQSIKEAKEAIQLLVKMIPKGVRCGSSDLVNQATIMNNHLIEALLKITSATELSGFTLSEIEALEAEHNGLNCSILKAKILFLKGDQAKAIRLMHESIKLHPRDGLMLIEQCNFLISQNRADLALKSAIRCVECLPTEFEAWKVLIKVHILNKDFHSALLALNSAPMYSNKRKDVFRALKPKSFKFPFPTEGKLAKVWNDCEAFGCISGVGGIMEFSPSSHIESIDPLHLTVYEQTKLQSTFKEAYELLAIMVRHLGWRDLLKLRSKVFVMEDEYYETASSSSATICDDHHHNQSNNNNQLTVNTNGESGRGRSTSVGSRSASVSSSAVSKKFKSKRLSERWLDSLFLIFYENLKSVLIWENEKSNNDLDSIQHIALEWELIGGECFKVHRFESGLIPFRTCIDNRFSIFACHTLLNYYVFYRSNKVEFMKLNMVKNEQQFKYYMISDDYILKLTSKLISWNYRYYGEFSMLVLEVLKLLIEQDDSGSVLLKSKLEILFEHEEDRHGIVALVDRYVDWIEHFKSST